MDASLRSVRYAKYDNWCGNPKVVEGITAQTYINNSKSSNDVSVVAEKVPNQGWLWRNFDKDELVELLKQQNNLCLFELIPNKNETRKVYFDIEKNFEETFDEKKGFQEFINKKIKTVKSFFKNADLAISGSCGVIEKDNMLYKRASLHIIINNYLLNSYEDLLWLKQLVIHIKTYYDEDFDDKVYSKNRQFKMIGQSKREDKKKKRNDRIQKIIMCDDIRKHLITQYFPSERNPLREFDDFIETKNPKIEKIKFQRSKNLSFTALPNCEAKRLFELDEEYKQSLDIFNLSLQDMLCLLPNSTDFDFIYNHRIVRYAYQNYDEAKEFNEDCLIWKWLSLKDNGKAFFDKWVYHYGREEINIQTPKEQIIQIILKYNSSLNRNCKYKRFTNSFNIDESKIIKIYTLSHNHFTLSKKKFLLFNLGMGSGKTCQTINYLRAKKFVWITPNKALTSNTFERFKQDRREWEEQIKEEQGLEEFTIEEYEDNYLNTNKFKLAQSERLLICLNSLLKLKDYDFSNSIIVIDEVETVLNLLFSSTSFINSEDKHIIWNTLKRCLTQSKQVIMLDAFITNKTIEFVNDLDNNNYAIFEKKKNETTRNVKFFKNFHFTISKIINDLENGKKLFIFYPYKKGTQRFLSMESLVKSIKSKTKKKITFYHGDCDDEIKDEIKNVNHYWKDVDVVITNNVITCGVNYDQLGFNSVYLFIASHNSPRDMIQVSFRVRHLIDNYINVCFLGKMTGNDLLETSLIDDEVFSHLNKNYNIEYFSPIRQSFKYFCHKAFYNMTDDNIEIMNDEDKEELRQLFSQNLIESNFDDIKTLDEDELRYVRDRSSLNLSTYDEKLQLQKHYFKKQFKFIPEYDNMIEDDVKYNADVMNAVRQLWNADNVKFVDTVIDDMSNEKSIFYQIQQENKLDAIFPDCDDLTELKCSDELKDLIFETYTFKNLNKKSHITAILEKIYNNRYNYIVKNEKTKRKHPKRYISEDAFEYLELIEKYVKKGGVKQNDCLINLDDLDFDNSENDCLTNLDGIEYENEVYEKSDIHYSFEVEKKPKEVIKPKKGQKQITSYIKKNKIKA